ncbi:DUF1398 domain-containing protein [Sphingobacterium hungaricum]|uniref:Phage envelope protein n=1 Tax=Sphingobacterium hungaricum TaxID=2082723 RepID=A0A928UV44_9SPHI|nr:DUF1398 family protein [Sphingobacterium hungaricum]MBE8712131.1 phage envelope protein [Sphingobacterium hungaricum]
MFTVQQIDEAHSKVKSGAEFPAYIQEIKTFGVKSFETFVSDGHTDYHGDQDYRTSSDPLYAPLVIAQHTNAEQFSKDLKNHQQGGTDFFTFCADCAKSGIEKWIVDLDKMTCIYYDQSGQEILTEQIPS